MYEYQLGNKFFKFALLFGDQLYLNQLCNPSLRAKSVFVKTSLGDATEEKRNTGLQCRDFWHYLTEEQKTDLVGSLQRYSSVQADLEFKRSIKIRNLVPNYSKLSVLQHAGVPYNISDIQTNYLRKSRYFLTGVDCTAICDHCNKKVTPLNGFYSPELGFGLHVSCFDFSDKLELNLETLLVTDVLVCTNQCGIHYCCPDCDSPCCFFCDRIEHLENQKIISLCNKCWHDGEQKRSGLNSIVFGRSTASNATVDQRQYRPLARAHQEEKDKGNILFDGNEQCTVRSRGRWSDKASCVLKIHPFAEKENSPIPSWRPLTWEEITVDERFSLYHTQTPRQESREQRKRRRKFEAERVFNPLITNDAKWRHPV